jgi:hypothetical protein
LGLKPWIPDAARLQALLIPPNNNRGTASFTSYRSSLDQNQDRATLQFINPQQYDGTFIPSNSVRTVEPPEVFRFPWEAK